MNGLSQTSLVRVQGMPQKKPMKKPARAPKALPDPNGALPGPGDLPPLGHEPDPAILAKQKGNAMINNVRATLDKVILAFVLWCFVGA